MEAKVEISEIATVLEDHHQNEAKGRKQWGIRSGIFS